MRMRKKPNLAPRMERCAAMLIPDPASMRGHWKDEMPEAREIRLEIGCGKGRLTVETAAAGPDVLFVAIERVADAMVIAMERANEQGIANVRFIDADAERMPAYFAPGEVSRIYLNFSDPWPSNRHAKRRLTHTDFLMRYRQILPEKGEIHMKTDNQDLFEWSLFQFPKAGFRLEQVTRDLHRDGVCGIMTDYEEKFHHQGMPINRCVAVREALPAEMAGWIDPLDKPRGGQPSGGED